MPAIVAALPPASAKTATTTLTDRAVKGLLDFDWGGTPEEKNLIEEKVGQRAVLGSSKNMERTSYAASPILKYVKDFGQAGVVNVAYVPPSMGKTTACHAIMKKYVKEGTNRGLCFSPNANSRPYLEHMVTKLGFTDTKAPPDGLVDVLLEALVVSCDGKPSYLILDDYMPDGPTNIDIDLLLAIKTKIRSQNIIVIVLTASRDSADYMLTMNNLETIIPLVGTAAMRIIRAEFRQGKHNRHDMSFHLNWETHLSMEWDAREMKNAILVNPLYKGKCTQQQEDLKREIDTVLQQYTVEDQKTVSPAVVLQALKESCRSIQPI